MEFQLSRMVPVWRDLLKMIASIVAHTHSTNKATILPVIPFSQKLL